jgi:carboxyl-terminal processing protease
MKRLFALLFALVIATAACSGGTTTDTTDSVTESSTTTGVPPETGSSVAENGRITTAVSCADAPSDVVIVCEAYDLIRRLYVDDVPDVALAEAATNAVLDLDGSNSTTDLVCPLPSPAFTATCDALADEAENNTEAAEAILRGLANALDPNSVYLDQEALALIEEEQEGQIEGIGALVTAEDSTITEDNPQCSIISDTCRLLIVSVIDSSPAQVAGLQANDMIIGVNGQNITGWSLDQVTATVRGPAGTDVLLKIDRTGTTLDISITRAAVVIPVVSSSAFGDIGYVTLNLFTETADEQLQTAIQDLLDQGINELVLDLRNDPGGLLDTAIEVTSLFLADGDVVVTQSPEDNRAYSVTGNRIVPEDLPVVIIMNKGSASASEVVSAVLQERGRATIVGENSFGKNTVQQRFSLSNGGAFKLTIARWVTPGGLDFGGDGLTPDVALEFPPDLDTEGAARLAAGTN